MVMELPANNFLGPVAAEPTEEAAPAAPQQPTVDVPTKLKVNVQALAASG